MGVPSEFYLTIKFVVYYILKPTTFSESWVRKDSVGTCPKNLPIENFRVRSDLQKFSLFHEFSCRFDKKLKKKFNPLVTL